MREQALDAASQTPQPATDAPSVNSRRGISEQRMFVEPDSQPGPVPSDEEPC